MGIYGITWYFLEVNGFFNYLLTKFIARWPISRVLYQFDDDHSSCSIITH